MRVTTIAIVVLICAAPLLTAGTSVSNVTLTPATPNVLVTNQKVTVTFSYSTQQTGGVVIWAIPFTGTSMSPNLSNSGSLTLTAPSGTIVRDFTITGGNVTVDRVRILIQNPTKTQTLLDVYLPVNYQFRAP